MKKRSAIISAMSDEDKMRLIRILDILSEKTKPEQNTQQTTDENINNKSDNNCNKELNGQ